MVDDVNKIFTDHQKEVIISHFGKNHYNKAVHDIQIYIEKWHLSNFELIDFFSSNLLLTCLSRKHGQSVLKIGYHNHFHIEINVLHLYNGHHYCQVYEYSAEDKICLIELILPGNTLFHETTRDERISFFCDLYSDLHIAPKELLIYPTYLNWLEEGEYGINRRDDCALFKNHVRRAKDIIISVSSVFTRKFLLHGDLHHENILKNQTGKYTAIDPKGVIGDPVFDVSRFILDEFHDDLTSEPKENIGRFVYLLAQRLHVPVKILLQCLYVETVIWLCREELAVGKSLEDCEWLIRNIIVADEMLRNI